MAKIYLKHPFFLTAFLWFFPVVLQAQQTIAEWNFPNNPDDAVVDIAVPVNSGISISSVGTNPITYDQTGATTNCANTDNWVSGSGTKYWIVTINTTGYTNLELSSKQRSSNTGPRDFKVQYRIGAGVWTDLTGATAIVAIANFTSGVISKIPLPAACENQPSVSLRWIMTSNIAANGGAIGSTGNSRIDDINISWSNDHYYRSVASGLWSDVTTWESSVDNITWNPAVMAPSNYSKTITIQSPHTVTINSDIIIDETIIQNGGTLNWATSKLSILDGPGVDLQNNGIFVDGSTTSVNFSAGATWSAGAASSMIKTADGSSNNWRDAYSGGISTIPATATWIIRKIGSPNPSVSSINMYYPNLIIENNMAGTWLASVASGFQGSTSNIVIKGYMDVGGTGSSTVEFENKNTNALATVVTGNLTVRSGNILRNYGTGFELFANLVCDGSIIYDSNDGRKIIFSGSAAQTISGSGSLNIFAMEMNKSAGDLTLLRSVKIDNNLNFKNPGGRIFSSSANLLTIESGATATGTSNTGFVHGPVRKLGDQAFTYPIGKNNDYQALAIGTGSSSASVFWTESFGSGCNQGQLASSYSGSNGTWNITNTGTNESNANTWFVSARENGNGVGNCGSGCGSNRTLHVGSTTPNDPGAAYLETDPFTCGFIGICSATDKRAESPVIDCSGKTGITLSMNYIEFGDGSNDNATLWYYDGTTWSMLADPAKTLCCGGVTCTGSQQALWTAFSIALPASANNNPNVKIGFRWVNNADGVATDPSFAVDDIALTGTITETFTAEYFRGNPQVIYNNVYNPFIDHISSCEYWTLTRDAGSSSRTVTLTWDGNSCGVTQLSELTVARFNGSSWDDRGNGGTTGNTTTGTVITAAPQTGFGPYTLASTTPSNPLPVELIDFSASFKNDQVHVKWSTASEINSDYFLMDRSANGWEYEMIGKKQAAGNSSSVLNYNFIDHSPLPGVSYYRLRQVDFDGTINLHRPVVVKAPGKSFNAGITSIFSDNSSGVVYIGYETGHDGNSVIQIIDATGRVITTIFSASTQGFNLLHLDVPGLAKGIYSVRIATAAELLTGRFFY